jgi:hypothetical protein
VPPESTRRRGIGCAFTLASRPNGLDVVA